MAIYIKKEVNGVEQEPKRVGVIPNGYPCRKLSYNNTQSGLDADNPQEAIDELSVRVINKNISQTYTGSPTDIVGVITSILTLAAPHTWNVGIYSGKIVSTHSGGGDLGTWAGLYQLCVAYQGAYGTKGYIIAQGYAFEFSYDNSVYNVKKLATSDDVKPITRNALDTPFSVASATINNPYEFLIDGYLQISTYSSNDSIIARVYGSNMQDYITIRQAVSVSATVVEHMFVKKGMKVAVESMTNNASIVFIPLKD